MHLDGTHLVHYYAELLRREEYSKTMDCVLKFVGKNLFRLTLTLNPNLSSLIQKKHFCALDKTMDKAKKKSFASCQVQANHLSSP